MSGATPPLPLTPAAAQVLGAPLWAWQGALALLGVAVLLLFARASWPPSVPLLRRWAFGNVAVNALITVTGATVRVTESGLGCSEWPNCTPGSFVPSGGQHHPVLNEAIEFGNRTLASVVLTVGLVVLVMVWRMHRADRRPGLLALAAAVPLGGLLQAFVGGVTVWTGLHPAFVNTHFLLSMLILAAAMTVYVRCREPGGPPRRVVSAPARHLATALVVVGFALLVAGAVTSGTGPHGGDIDAPRWPLDFPVVTRLHSTLAWLTLAGAVALAVVLARGPASRALRLRAGALLAVLLAQGATGYLQYALQLPEWLVVAHVLGSVLSWLAILRVHLGTVERTAPLTTAAAEPGPGAAAAVPR